MPTSHTCTLKVLGPQTIGLSLDAIKGKYAHIA